MANDVELRGILADDWAEACQGFQSKAWKSCVLLCGGIVEGLLLWQIEDVQKFAIATGKDPVRADVDYGEAPLSIVIRQSKEQGLIGPDEHLLMDWARTYRNIIHPGNQRREGRSPLKSHADLALKIVQVVADGVRAKSVKRSASANKAS
jgi:hypothetical protein